MSFLCRRACHRHCLRHVAGPPAGHRSGRAFRRLSPHLQETAMFLSLLMNGRWPVLNSHRQGSASMIVGIGVESGTDPAWPVTAAHPSPGRRSDRFGPVVSWTLDAAMSSHPMTPTAVAARPPRPGDTLGHLFTDVSRSSALGTVTRSAALSPGPPPPPPTQREGFQWVRRALHTT